MYRKNALPRTSARVNNSVAGETIEQKIRRIVYENEPIEDGAPIIFTERKDGVLPEHNIRTDRWELAVEAMDKVTKAQLAKRESKGLAPDQPGEGGGPETGKGGDSTDAKGK